MSAVTATEFAKSFGRYKEEAQREPIAITSHGRISGYFVSEREFKELQRLRALERRVIPHQGPAAGARQSHQGVPDGPGTRTSQLASQREEEIETVA